MEVNVCNDSWANNSCSFKQCKNVWFSSLWVTLHEFLPVECIIYLHSSMKQCLLREILATSLSIWKTLSSSLLYSTWNLSSYNIRPMAEGLDKFILKTKKLTYCSTHSSCSAILLAHHFLTSPKRYLMKKYILWKFFKKKKKRHSFLHLVYNFSAPFHKRHKIQMILIRSWMFQVWRSWRSLLIHLLHLPRYSDWILLALLGQKKTLNSNQLYFA